MAEAALSDHVCRCDAVVVARARSSQVLLSAKETFLFTHFVLSVDRWIRPPTDERQTVDITMSGGAVSVGDRVIRASISGLRYPSLDNEYVFFLVKIEGGAWYQSGEPEALGREPQNRADYLERLRRVAATCS